MVNFFLHMFYNNTNIMKIQNNTSLYSQNFKGTGNITNKIAKGFAKMGDIGEGASITCDFLGKAVVVPIVVMAASKEPKEKKEYSAFKNPVAAIIQLALEVPILLGGTKLIGDLADKGFFDKKNSDFSYNEKKFKKEFIDCFENQAKADENLKKHSKDFIEKVKSKGCTKNVIDDFDEIIKKTGENTGEILKKSFKGFETAHKNKFHLQNRLCFIAAIALTPLLCEIEDYLHPKIMHALYKNREKKDNGPILNITMNEYLNETKQPKKGAMEWAFKK